MSVKNGVASKALVTTIMFQGRFPFGYQRLVIIVVKKSLVIRLLYDQDQQLKFWFGALERIAPRNQGTRALSFFGAGRFWQDYTHVPAGEIEISR